MEDAHDRRSPRKLARQCAGAQGVMSGRPCHLVHMIFVCSNSPSHVTFCSRPSRGLLKLVERGHPNSFSFLVCT